MTWNEHLSETLRGYKGIPTELGGNSERIKVFDKHRLIAASQEVEDGDDPGRWKPDSEGQTPTSCEGLCCWAFNICGSAIITGSHGAIAMAVARALLQHSLSDLPVFDVNLIPSREKILALKTEFPRARIQCFEVDVVSDLETRRAVNATAAAFSSIDALVFCAGTLGAAHAISIPASPWRHILDINTTGTFHCARAGTGGRMVFTTSASGSLQSQVAHNVGKAALLMLKSTLAAEWTRYNISVNSIVPGYIGTTRNNWDGLVPAYKAVGDAGGDWGCGDAAEQVGSYINGPDIVVYGGGIVFEWWVIRLVCLVRCNNPTIPVSPLHCYPDFGFGEGQHPRR
ncbi:hypothetical protein BKA56DRAFT_611531 [Ilyonectria sp. MPI-CAGE-AT-0026]|nr:hypothetical protein BKA56DRAFT_611531 [Ilyonectria sp. MPI-CAGE-AT-0026]